MRSTPPPPNAPRLFCEHCTNGKTNTMTIQTGKQYKTRDGNRVTIYRTDAKGPYSVHGCIHHTHVPLDVVDIWSSDGKYNNLGGDRPLDIIAEWSEPVTFDWRQVPLCCNWIAMDSNGLWYAFDNKPNTAANHWTGSKCEYCITIHRYHYPKNFTGDWKDSLMQRPI